MSATVGVDCQVVLDGQGYFVEPKTYVVQRPRVRRASLTASGSERYIDLGPGKRVWRFVALGRSELLRYDGRPTGYTGQQYRDALVASYAKVAQTLGFTDLGGQAWTVRFDDYEEEVADPRTQLRSPGYLCHVSLVEA